MTVSVIDWFVVVENGGVSLYGEFAAGVVRSLTKRFSPEQLQDLAQRVRDDNDVDQLTPGKGYYPRTPSTMQRFENYLFPARSTPPSRALVTQGHFRGYHFPLRELPPKKGWGDELQQAKLRWAKAGYDLRLLHAQVTYLGRWWLNSGRRRIWLQRIRNGLHRLDKNPRAAVVYYIALTIALSIVFFVLIWIFIGLERGQRILDLLEL